MASTRPTPVGRAQNTRSISPGLAVLAPIAQFGILATLIVPADPAATGTKIAGSLGYIVDSLGRLLVADYSLTLSMLTFVGEALLIVWLFRLAIRGSRVPADGAGQLIDPVGVPA